MSYGQCPKCGVRFRYPWNDPPEAHAPCNCFHNPFSNDLPPERCEHCGKEYEDFSQVGCGRCDQRSPEFGVL